MIEAHPEQAPPSVISKRKLRTALLDGKQNTKVTTMQSKTPDTGEDTSKGIQQTPRIEPTQNTTHTVTTQDVIRVLFPENQKEFIELITEVGRFNFKVEALNITEYGIGFMLQADTLLEPTIGATLKVKIRRRVYEVIYMGGCFNFETIGYSLITFLLAKED